MGDVKVRIGVGDQEVRLQQFIKLLLSGEALARDKIRDVLLQYGKALLRLREAIAGDHIANRSRAEIGFDLEWWRNVMTRVFWGGDMCKVQLRRPAAVATRGRRFNKGLELKSSQIIQIIFDMLKLLFLIDGPHIPIGIGVEIGKGEGFEA